VLVFEDAHWIDPTSRELLDLVVDRARILPVLLIVTFRPEFQPPWTGQPQVTMLALNRLDRHDRTIMVEHITGGRALPDEVVAQITDRTDGVPLFVEELTKSVLESGLLREEWIATCSIAGSLPSPSRQHYMPHFWRASTAWHRCGWWPRLVPQSGASFPTTCCMRSHAFPRPSCIRLSLASLAP